LLFFFSSRRRHTRWPRDWSSDVCSSDLLEQTRAEAAQVNAQTLGLREKKPCDSGRNGRRVLASRQCRCGPGRCAVRDRVPRWARSEERRVGKECRCREGAEGRSEKVWGG